MARADRIGKHKTTVTTYDSYTCVQYHSTVVVKFNGREIILDSGGWRTNTTKTRMNQASREYGLGFYVFQDNFDWFVKLDDCDPLKFESGMKIDRIARKLIYKGEAVNA